MESTYEKKVLSFLENNDVDSMLLTLSEISLRDCTNNPKIYRETETIEQLLSLQSFLQELRKTQ